MDNWAVEWWREAESSSLIARAAPTHPRPGVSEHRVRLLAPRSPRRPDVPFRNSARRIQISNRKLQLLEYGPSHRKQTIASGSNCKLLRVAAILLPWRSARTLLCVLGVSAVSDFATKIGVVSRQITRHIMPSNFVTLIYLTQVVKVEMMAEGKAMEWKSAVRGAERNRIHARASVPLRGGHWGA